MRKINYSFFIIFFLIVSGCKSNDSETNTAKNEKEFSLDAYESSKFLNIKNFNAKSFIKYFTERYNKGPMNSVILAGEFPENWVKPTDVEYLMSIMKSKQKCCNYMNAFSSRISNEEAEVGGYAIIFLNSYISQTKINLRLNAAPKTDIESIRKIEEWYTTNENLQTN